MKKGFYVWTSPATKPYFAMIRPRFSCLFALREYSLHMLINTIQVFFILPVCLKNIICFIFFNSNAVFITPSFMNYIFEFFKSLSHIVTKLYPADFISFSLSTVFVNNCSNVVFVD